MGVADAAEQYHKLGLISTDRFEQIKQTAQALLTRQNSAKTDK